MLRPLDRIRKTFGSLRFQYILIWIAVAIANTFGTSVLFWVVRMTNDPELARYNDIIDAHKWIRPLSLIMPYPALLAVIVIYTLPVFRIVFSRKPAPEWPDYIKRRIANLPMLTAAISAGGWILGNILFQVSSMVMEPSVPLEFYSQAYLQIGILASISLVACYYMVEYHVHSVFMPAMFPEGVPDHIGKRIWNLHLPSRIMLFSFTLTILPGILLYRMLSLLENNGNNIFSRPFLAEVTLFFLILLVVTILLVYLTSDGIVRPVRRMRRFTQQIARGDFSHRLRPVTTDEIGDLQRAMNSMAMGLAEREKLYATLGSFVDPSVRDHLLNGELQLGGEEKVVTVLFTDLAGFTALSERREPAEIVRFLNVYFARISDIIHRHGGMVNKFMGDAVMAVFGAPEELANSPGAALMAALEIRHLGSDIHALFPEWPQLQTRVGLHTGPVIAGNIGAQDRMEYTVIGDTVNIASRLENACKKLETDILLSGSVADMVQGYDLRSLGSLLVPGRSEALRVFTPA